MHKITERFTGTMAIKPAESDDPNAKPTCVIDMVQKDREIEDLDAPEDDEEMPPYLRGFLLGLVVGFFGGSAIAAILLG